MQTVQNPSTAPVQGVERMDTLDAVRGAALFGILLANAFPLSGLAFASPGAPAGLPLAWLHEPLTFLVFFLVEGKFYSLFSFLFGVGFAVFISRAAARGADPSRLFKRRLVGLLLIGVAHTLLIWMGDILMTYAVIGFALLPFARRTDRQILRWAAAMLALPILLYGCLAIAFAAAGGPTEAEAAPPGALPLVLAEAVVGFERGDYRDVVAGNAVFTIAQIARRFILMFFPRVFGMFLLGFLVGRHGMFADLQRHRPLLRRVLLWGLVLGLPLSWAGALFEGAALGRPGLMGFLETTLKTIGTPALALAYGAALGLVLPRWTLLRHALAPVGQMALTNYLLQSVAGVAIFYGIGFGVFGRVPLAVVLAGAVAFFVLQMIGSRLWLAHAAFGPVEWLWRMFTYDRRVPLFADRQHARTLREAR